MIVLSDYLKPDLVLFLESKSRDEALLELVALLKKKEDISDSESFYKAILDREKIVSTGIGMGVAIPHAKLPTYNNFFIAVGILQEKGVDWKAMDGAPVRLIFLVGGPDDKQTEYLQLLSTITVSVKDQEKRKLLLKMSTPEQVVDLLCGV